MRRVLVGLAGVAALLGLLWLALVVSLPLFVQHRSLEVAKAQNDVRTTLLQGLGGLAVLAAALFTYQQLQTSRRQLDHTIESSRQQHELDRQGQVTERFTRAIDQLGHENLDVRLGGIYALARIARDSPADRATISEVLIAFVRGHASWPPRFPDQPADTEPIDQVLALQVRAADIQAIMTVLGTGGFGAGPVTPGARLELHAVDLRRAQLIGVHLGGVQLDGAHLEKAKLDGAYLGRRTLAVHTCKGESSSP